MNARSYTPLQITLHWLSAAVIVWALCSGFLVAFADLAVATEARISALNVSLTALLTPLFALRMLLAWRHRHQRLHAPGLKGALARHAHLGLYAVSALVLLTGIIMMDRQIRIFDVISFAQPVTDPALLTLFHGIHRYACVVLGLLVTLHVAAVLFHQWRRTPVLRRMWY